MRYTVYSVERSSAAINLGAAHIPLRTQVADELRRRITDRELAPGARLVEHQLAEQLGVSRNPVREAIRVLESEGFVVTVPRRGVVVATLDAQSVTDLFQVRAGLEGMAAELAAGRVAAGEVTVDALQGVLAEARLATESGDVTSVGRLNSEFHAGIVALTGNLLLTEMVRPVMWRVRWVFRLSAEERAPHSWTEHLGLLEALTAGDPEAARRLAIEHVQKAERAALLAIG
ncbi:DNA-binding GntR family transcriptional regulator [Enemella evansiae]|nr:DNA-binding GntR family transcriptional regulator [Enemella evansiae]